MKLISNKKYNELIEKNNNLYNSLQDEILENKKLVDWIVKLLEAKGYQIDKVPYSIEMQNRIENWEGHEITTQTKETIIPEIRIREIQSFNNNYLNRVEE